MKLFIKPRVLSCAIILGAGLLQTGCVTTGIQRSTNTRITMGAVEQDYKEAVIHLDATGDSMEILVKMNEPDEKKAFDNYSANVRKMRDAEKRLFEHADKMRVQQREYFEEWRMQGNTYTNPRIQSLSEQRRVDLSDSFVKITEASVGVKGAFKAYMTDIEEIRKYLSTDLTPKGVEAITPTIQKAVSDGDALSGAIKPVLDAIDNARDEMAQGGNRQ